MVEQNDGEEEFGFDLEEVLAAEREVLQGNSMTSDEFFAGLRAKLEAAGHRGGSAGHQDGRADSSVGAKDRAGANPRRAPPSE